MYLMRWKMQGKQRGPNEVRWIDPLVEGVAAVASATQATVVPPDSAEAFAWTEDIAAVCSTAVCQTATVSQFMCLASIR